MIGLAFALRGTFGRTHGIERAAIDHVLDEFARSRGLTIDTSALERATAGADLTRPVRADLRRVFSSALGAHLVRDVDDVVLESIFRAVAARLARDRFVPFPDVRATLAEFAELNLPCAALGDGWPSIEVRVAEAVGFRGPLVFAEDHDVDGTSPVAFARLAEALALPADQIWFVGTDARTEIRSALAVGMHAIWIDRNGEPYPDGERRPDATVTSFAGLLDVIGEPYTRGLLDLRHMMRTTLAWRPGRVVAVTALEALEQPPTDERA